MCILTTAILLLWLPATALAAASQWCETITSRFHLISDLPAEDQMALISLLGRFEQIAEPFLPGEPVNQRTTLRLIIFENRSDFLKLTGKRQFAGYMQPSLETNRLLIGPIRGDVLETTLHEYAHYLLRNRTGVSLPMWFDEGLATLLGYTGFDDETARIGWIPEGRLRERTRRKMHYRSPQADMLSTLSTTSLERLSKDRIDTFYDWSLLLAHFLYFDVYADKLAAGTIHRSPLQAYLADGGNDLPQHLSLTDRQLLRALEGHLKTWKEPLIRAATSPTEFSPAYRCLDDLHRDLALAQAIHIQNPDKARALLAPHSGTQADLDVDLLVTLARIELAADRPEESTGLVEAALAASPGHAEASVLAADLLVRDCLFFRNESCPVNWQQAATLYRDAIRKDPNRYAGILGLGLAHLHTGRPGEAVNYLKVAYARAPWAAVINYYLGESLRLVGDSRATPYLLNARNWAVSDFWKVLATESLRRIAELEAGTNSAAAGIDTAAAGADSAAG